MLISFYCSNGLIEKKLKKSKKHKKSKGKYKHRNEESDHEPSPSRHTRDPSTSDEDRYVVRSKRREAIVEEQEESKQKPISSSSSKQEFFALLLAKEGSSGSEQIGTVHAVGHKSHMSSTKKEEVDTQKWACGKCGHENPKHVRECLSCRALKRMSEWR